MWWIEHAKDIAEAVALLCAGTFFAYKAYTGYLRVNLSLSVQCQRQASATAGEDYLVVVVRLAKGANGGLTLHDVKARIAHRQEVQFLSFAGVSRSEYVSELQPYARKVVDWSRLSEQSPLLKVVPGEETQLATFCTDSRRIGLRHRGSCSRTTNKWPRTGAVESFMCFAAH